jgi:phosphoglycolate phosphatase
MATIRCGQRIFENIQAILFDKDGTLANSARFLQALGRKRAACIEAVVPGITAPLLQAFGIGDNTINPAGLIAVGSSREDATVAAGYIVATGRPWISSLNIAEAAFAEADATMYPKAKETLLFVGAREMLQSLAQAQVKLGVVSSDTPENVAQFVEYYDLEPYVQLQMGERPGLNKPNPKIIELACAQLGVSLTQTLMVGDSAADMVMGKAAGVAGCIGVTWGWPTQVSIEATDVVLSDISELQVVSTLESVTIYSL